MHYYSTDERTEVHLLQPEFVRPQLCIEPSVLLLLDWAFPLCYFNNECFSGIISETTVSVEGENYLRGGCVHINSRALNCLQVLGP